MVIDFFLAFMPEPFFFMPPAPFIKEPFVVMFELPNAIESMLLTKKKDNIVNYAVEAGVYELRLTVVNCLN